MVQLTVVVQEKVSLSLFTDAVCKTNINKAWRKYKTSKAFKWLPLRMNQQRNQFRSAPQ